MLGSRWGCWPKSPPQTPPLPARHSLLLVRLAWKDGEACHGREFEGRGVRAVHSRWTRVPVQVVAVLMATVAGRAQSAKPLPPANNPLCVWMEVLMRVSVKVTLPREGVKVRR